MLTVCCCCGKRSFLIVIKIGAGSIAGAIIGYLFGSRRRSQAREPNPILGPDLPALTEVSLVEILKFLSKTHRSIHSERIKSELHVVITTLSFYAAAVSLKYTGILKPENISKYKYIIWVGFLSLAVAAFIYLWGSAAATKVNQKRLAERAENALIALLQRTGVINLEIPEKHPARLRWVWEAAIIALGALLSVFVITEGT
jgi:hypothetical protein